jgi:hypothetical protein
MIRKSIKDYDFNNKSKFVFDLQNNKYYNLFLMTFITWRLIEYMNN